MNRDKAAHEIRTRISEIKGEIDDEFKFREYAATHDYEFRMSEARTEALQAERNRLQEILGDL